MKGFAEVVSRPAAGGLLRMKAPPGKSTPRFPYSPCNEKEAVALAAQLIERQSGKFEPKTMPDPYAAAVKEYLSAKVEQRAPEVTIEAEGTHATQVINIMDALKKSMQKQGQNKVSDVVRKRTGKPAAKTARSTTREPPTSRARRSVS
jgi:non-homologous end joining protein Ku